MEIKSLFSFNICWIRSNTLRHLAPLYLLDKVHNKINTQVSAEMKGKDVVLIQDSWSDTHNTPVSATSLQFDGKAYFMSTIDTGTNKKTAAYCTSMPKTPKFQQNWRVKMLPWSKTAGATYTTPQLSPLVFSVTEKPTSCQPSTQEPTKRQRLTAPL